MSSFAAKQTLPLAGIIAGTLVDTALGANYLKNLGWDVNEFAISQTPQEQNNLQLHFANVLQDVCLNKMIDMQCVGVECIVIYCSSLSSVLNIQALQEKIDIPIYTPFNYYKQIAPKYSQFAAIAANAIGLKGLEATITDNNKSAKVIGLHNINIVRQIELNNNPKQIITNNGLPHFITLVEELNCECIVLACTHFSCIKLALQSCTTLPIFDINSGLLPLLQTVNNQPITQKEI